jgi:hypothetical protein
MQPDSDIIKWGLAVEAAQDEYYTGLMERVVDGPQHLSWAPGRKEVMNRAWCICKTPASQRLVRRTGVQPRCFGVALPHSGTGTAVLRPAEHSETQQAMCVPPARGIIWRAVQDLTHFIWRR